MSKFNVEINKDGDLTFAVDNLLTDDVCRRLVKLAIFDSLAMEGISKMLVHGVIEWDDEDGYQPWWITWTGKGDPFEKARLAFLELASPVIQKLVSDLTDEREKLDARREQTQKELWEAKRTIDYLRNELRQLREPSGVV